MSSPVRVVLVDDDPGVLRALGMLLSALGYSVMPFASAQEALAHIQTRDSIDVVVSDLRMPEQSGEDLLKAVRRERPALPVVIMSGHATTEEVTRLSSLGMGAFLPKPFTPDAFRESLNKLLLKDSRERAA